MTSEQPFKFAVPDNELALLKRKLDDTCLSDEVNPADGPTARHSQTSGGSPAGGKTGTTGARTSAS